MITSPESSFRAITNAVIDECDESDAIVLTREVRRLRGYLDVFEAQLTSHLKARKGQGLGSGAPPIELLSNASGCSQSERDRRELRSGTLDQADEFADALGEGFARRCRDLITRIQRDQGIARAARQRANTRLSRRIDNVTGMHHINGSFDPETGERLFTALDAELAALIDGAHTEHRDMERDQLAAHALANLVAAGHGEIRPAVTEVSVHVDWLTALTAELHEHSICELEDGTPIPPVSARRLLCDASVVPIIRGSNGVPLNAGRTRRQANREQRRALRSMYRTCAFSGCTRRFSQCEIHHIIEWLDDGLTDLDNLLPLCSYHHHMVHEGGWGLSMDIDRNLTIRRPDGSIHAIEPIHIRLAESTNSDPAASRDPRRGSPGEPCDRPRAKVCEPSRSAVPPGVPRKPQATSAADTELLLF